MSIFDKLNNTKDYEALIRAFNPKKPTKEQQTILVQYRTPNRSYIKTSARDIGYDEVTLDTLQYIIITCYQCSFEEKYLAILMVLQKTYLTYEGTSLVDTYISEAKEELIPHVLTQTKKRIIDLSFVDTCTRDYSDNFFYLVKITIGANTILKYGMTNQKPRKRFVQIKNDIALNYNKQTITLEPLMIIHCNNAESFEEEIKTCLSEHNISTTGYKFKGSTETIRYRELNDTLDVIHLLGEKFQTDVLYAS